MASLRSVEERDSKGNLIRYNPTIMFVQDRQIRRIKGRFDYDLIDNPDYHPPIAAQVQGDRIHFFLGSPHSSRDRAVAKEITQEKVREIAPKVLEELRRNPVRVREARPMVYEVKIANIDGEEVPVAEEHVLQPGTAELTVSPVAPERWQGDRIEQSGAPLVERV